MVNPAYVNTHRAKKLTSIDKISDSLFDDDLEEDEDYIWDKNLDSGLVSNVSTCVFQNNIVETSV